MKSLPTVNEERETTRAGRVMNALDDVLGNAGASAAFHINEALKDAHESAEDADLNDAEKIQLLKAELREVASWVKRARAVIRGTR